MESGNETRAIFRKKMIEGRTQISWPKVARVRVREGGAKLKLPQFYKVNGKLKRGPTIICTCSCSVAVSMEKKTFLFRSGGGPPPKYDPARYSLPSAKNELKFRGGGSARINYASSAPRWLLVS